MAGIPGTDYPEVRTVVDLLLSSRPDAMISWVEAAHSTELVLAPAEDRTRHARRLAVGERMDVVWRGPDDLLSLPAELVAVESGADPVWHLRPLGPAIRGQRRASVRAPMLTPVLFEGSAGPVPGTTLDVSEGGLRVLLDACARRRTHRRTAGRRTGARLGRLAGAHPGRRGPPLPGRGAAAHPL